MQANTRAAAILHTQELQESGSLWWLAAMRLIEEHAHFTSHSRHLASQPLPQNRQKHTIKKQAFIQVQALCEGTWTANVEQPTQAHKTKKNPSRDRHRMDKLTSGQGSWDQGLGTPKHSGPVRPRPSLPEAYVSVPSEHPRVRPARSKRGVCRESAATTALPGRTAHAQCMRRASHTWAGTPFSCRC